MKEMGARSGGGTADNGDGRGFGGARLKDRKARRMSKRRLSSGVSMGMRGD
jgi:hypothetical protein